LALTYFYLTPEICMQTFSSENCTQGQIDKSQQELKRTRLRNGKYRNLAELAVVYHCTHDALVAEHENGFRKKFSKKIKVLHPPEQYWF